jgi:Cyanobacterial TRADD-N associated 2-Transmembrane domain
MSGISVVITEAETTGRDLPPSLQNFWGQHDQPRRHNGAWLTSIPLILIAVAAGVGGEELVRSHASGWLAPSAFATCAFFLMSSTVVPLFIAREVRLEKAEKERCQTDCQDLYWALDHMGDRTLKGLAFVNFKELRIFTVIAQKQARMSYYASLVAASATLLVLVSGAAVAIGSPIGYAKIAAGVLATIGAAFSSFLVKTFLKAYQMSSRQMSYYYGQPVVHCYMLHAEWLASEAGTHLNDADRARLWEKVVDASIKAGTDAQGHLLSMQECTGDGNDADSAGHRLAGWPGARTTQAKAS